MIMESEKVAGRIRRLEIQGAINVASRGIKALSYDIKHSRAKTLGAFRREFAKNSGVLAKARPTEPALRNGLAFVEEAMADGKDLVGKKKAAVGACGVYLNQLRGAKEGIIKVGVKRIKSGMTVMTHCHSSTVTGILIAAKKRGVRFNVLNTETRPRYQGRITARELAEAGIPVTHIVDSAARRFMNDVDLVLVGADAITAEGNLVNKIGTSQIALAAHEAKTEFACACETFKFDPLTFSGTYEPIEERNGGEVWKRPPRGVKIRNPAFDITPPEYVDYIITEEGIITPYEATHILRERAER